MGGKNTKPVTQPGDSKHHHASSSLSFLYVKTNKGNKHRQSPVKQNATEVSSSSSSSPSTTPLVTSQSHQLDNQDIKEVMPVIFGGTQHKNIENIIWDYSSVANATWLEKPFTFFGISSLKKQILALAYDAAPLELVEAYIREADARKESHLSSTLVQATIEAIQNLDVNILDEKGGVIAEGMAERFMRLHKELHPKTFPTSLTQIRLSVPLETKEEKQAREAINVAAMNQVFDAIKQGNTCISISIKNLKEIKNFKEFVRQSTQLNRLHLLFVAFDVLARRCRELSLGWSGRLSEGFCYEVIGIAIEKDFSPRMRQIIEIGILPILNREKEAARRLDTGGKTLAATYDVEECDYYDVFGFDPCIRPTSSQGRTRYSLDVLPKLIKSNDTSVMNLCSDRTFSRRAVP